MKKILSSILVLILLFTCVACGKTEPTNADSTTTTESTTESTTKDESTTESVSEDESTTVVEESTTKAQNEEETTKKNDTTTTNKSESTTKKTETTTKKTETTTKKPSANTTTTTTKPSASKPYFVSLEIVSIKRVQNFYVDGMHVLDRIYGKNKCLQYGDTLELRVNMSDGGSSGFKVVQVSAGTYTVKGNIISITINQRDPAVMIDVLTVDKNGEQIYGTKEIKIHHSSNISDDEAIRSYAEARGLQLLNGTNEEHFVHYKVKIPGNSNWHSQAFAAIDKCVNAGCTRYCYQVVPQDAFEIQAYK
jgi:predicted small lipoprotein YifL